MPIVIQRNNNRSQGLNELGQGMTNAVQNWLTGNQQLARMQAEENRNAMQLAMMGRQMEKENRALAAQEAITKALSGVDYSNPAKAMQQVIPYAAQSPQAVGAILGGLGNMADMQFKQETRQEERQGMQQLRDMVAGVAKETGVPQQFAMNVAEAESGYNPSAVSPAGARGVMQLMPGTAKELGVNPDVPHENIKGGVNYLGKMLNMFGGSAPLAAMAYNWGPGNVKSYLENGTGVNGQPIPEETKKYVEKTTGVPIDAILLPGKAGQLGKDLYEAGQKERQMEFERKKYEESKTPRPTYQDLVKEEFAMAAGVPEKERTPEQAAAYQKGIAFGLQKFDKTREQDKTYSSVVLQDIGKAKEMASGKGSLLPTTGIGSIMSGIPGTKAHDLAATLDTIKANIGFDRLQKMRAESPTGGALGSVSDSENKMLQSTLGSLAQSQSREQFMQNLDRLENVYLDIVHGKGNWRKGTSGVEVGDSISSSAASKVQDYSTMSDEDLLRGLYGQ